MDEGLGGLFDRIERRLKRLESELLRDLEEALRTFDVEQLMRRRSYAYADIIEPLYAIHDLGDRLVVYVDLPYSNEGSLEVKFEGRRMYVSATLRESVQLESWSRRYSGVEVRGYSARINLPFEPKPENVRVRFKRGMVEITIFKG